MKIPSRTKPGPNRPDGYISVQFPYRTPSEFLNPRSTHGFPHPKSRVIKGLHYYSAFERRSQSHRAPKTAPKRPKSLPAIRTHTKTIENEKNWHQRKIRVFLVGDAIPHYLRSNLDGGWGWGARISGLARAIEPTLIDEQQSLGNPTIVVQLETYEPRMSFSTGAI